MQYLCRKYEYSTWIVNFYVSHNNNIFNAATNPQVNSESENSATGNLARY